MSPSNPYEAPDVVEPDELPASRTRYVVLAFLCSMAFVLYLDRVCISQAVGPIQEELGLKNEEMSYVLMAFTLAYGLFEIPTGHWGDRYGSRRILTRIVVWWSVFTGLTAACVGLYSLIVVRFLFGAGEAGAYPNAARVISRWFPASERGRVQGLFQAASLLGGALSPAVAGVIIQRTGWRWPFVIFGGLGTIWAAVFYVWFRDEPSEHPQVNAGEARLLATAGHRATQHVAFPWRDTFTHPTIWLLGFLTTCSAFNSYLYFSWYPKYLQSARGVALVDSGLMASLVLFGAMIGTMLGGSLVDRIVRRMTHTVAPRRAIACAGFVVAAALLLVSRQIDSAWGSAALAACSCIALFTQQTVWWSAATQVAGRYIGALFGLMNGLGVFGAMASQYFVGAFADWRKTQGFEGREQWDPMFTVYAIVLVVGAVTWLLVNPTRVVGEGNANAHH